MTDGGFVVSWQSDQDGTYDIYARRYDADSATAPDPEFHVNASTAGIQNATSVAALDDGAFVVTWNSDHSDTGDIFGRRFTSGGMAAGAESIANTETATGRQWAPSVTGLGDDSSYLLNPTWADAGMFLAWNLMQLVSGPANIALAEQREDAGHLRRLALHMAVVGQVAVAWEQLKVSRESLDLASRIYDVDERIYGHTVAGAESEVQTEIQLIRTEAARLASRARSEMAYVEREEALAALRVSIRDAPPCPASTRSSRARGSKR